MDERKPLCAVGEDRGGCVHLRERSRRGPSPRPPAAVEDDPFVAVEVFDGNPDRADPLYILPRSSQTRGRTVSELGQIGFWDRMG